MDVYHNGNTASAICTWHLLAGVAGISYATRLLSQEHTLPKLISGQDLLSRLRSYSVPQVQVFALFVHKQVVLQPRVAIRPLFDHWREHLPGLFEPMTLPLNLLH